MSPKRKDADLDTYRGRFGKQIRKMRDALGYSVEEVVDRVNRFGGNVSLSSYYGWETGRRKFDPDSLPALAKALKVKSVHEIMPKK